MTADISTINIQSESYPELLKNIPDAPKTLYFKGTLKPEGLCIAVIGARMCSDYGKRAAGEIARGLALAGITVVSGLAPGIDTIAHKSALEANGRTIAVLGTGLDKKSIYPKSNLLLSEKIVASNGCLLSEYPEGTSGAKFTFPRRNRIISGLSLAIVVVEAKERSGSLITAEHAKKQGRTIFSVPGSIYSPNSRGCNLLIKKGAKPAVSAGDILEELGIEAFSNPKAAKENSPEEASILGALANEALDIDKIVLTAKLPIQTVMSLIPLMEINGLIKDLGNGKYCRNQ